MHFHDRTVSRAPYLYTEKDLISYWSRRSRAARRGKEFEGRKARKGVRGPQGEERSSRAARRGKEKEKRGKENTLFWGRRKAAFFLFSKV